MRNGWLVALAYPMVPEPSWEVVLACSTPSMKTCAEAAPPTVPSHVTATCVQRPVGTDPDAVYTRMFWDERSMVKRIVPKESQPKRKPESIELPSFFSQIPPAARLLLLTKTLAAIVILPTGSLSNTGSAPAFR